MVDSTLSVVNFDVVMVVEALRLGIFGAFLLLDAVKEAPKGVILVVVRR